MGTKSSVLVGFSPNFEIGAEAPIVLRQSPDTKVPG